MYVDIQPSTFLFFFLHFNSCYLFIKTVVDIKLNYFPHLKIVRTSTFVLLQKMNIKLI